LSDHIPEVDPDPELDPLLGPGVRIPLRHASLDFDRASNGIDHAGELGQKAVPGVLDYPAPAFGDLGLTNSPSWVWSRSCVPSSPGPISRESPATSAARMAARRRTEAMSCPVEWLNQP